LAKDLSAEILKERTMRYGSVEDAHCLTISTLLDPRVKNHSFQNPSKLSRAINHVKDEASRLSQEQQEPLPTFW